jgi:hypothetical protein
MVLQIVIFSKGVRVRESLYRALYARDYFVGLSPTKLLLVQSRLGNYGVVAHDT